MGKFISIYTYLMKHRKYLVLLQEFMSSLEYYFEVLIKDLEKSNFLLKIKLYIQDIMDWSLDN